MSQRGQKWVENYFEGRASGLNHRDSEAFAFWSGANITSGQIIAALVLSFALVGGGLFWFVNLEPPERSAASGSLGDAQLAETNASPVPAPMPALSYDSGAGAEPVTSAMATSSEAGVDARAPTQAGVAGQPANEVVASVDLPKVEMEANGPVPIWAHRPSFEEAQRYYPEDAQRKGLSGGAILNCGLDIRGYVTGCRVVGETVEGQGFGEAALRLSRRFVAQPLPDGSRVTWRFDLPITFKATL